MLPVASLGASAFGRRLGMEAAGVVVAVGKDVTDFKVLL
jgi:NADPH:quinone reductase-like Zn-dependent oxidoreductase